LEFYKSARRYEPGSLPTAQIAGLEAAIDLLTEFGIETVQNRILQTVSQLREGLLSRDWRITTPEPFASGILAAVPLHGDARAIAKELEGRGIIVAPREGAVRFSPHFYNDQTEVARILDAIDAAGD
jgi:selenocysteine lyase/cysteine desulfurase